MTKKQTKFTCGPRPSLPSVIEGTDSDIFPKILEFYTWGVNNPKIIDVTCGHRIFWRKIQGKYNVIFSDIRPEVNPNYVMDVLSPIPEILERGPFDVVVFDPPHLDYSPTSMFFDKYGSISDSELTKMLETVNRYFTKLTKDRGLVIAKIFDDRRKGIVIERHTQLAQSMVDFDLIDIIIKWSKRQKKAQENWRGGQKNPVRSIPQHSYFLIFRKKGSE